MEADKDAGCLILDIELAIGADRDVADVCSF